MNIPDLHDPSININSSAVQSDLQHNFPGLDMYYTDPAQHIAMAGQDLDDLDDLNDLYDLHDLLIDVLDDLFIYDLYDLNDLHDLNI